MNVTSINQALLSGNIDAPEVFPHLEALKESHTVFPIDFGLQDLPREPGLISIRGARQFGKSTWLEQQTKKTIETFGPGSAFYINGDEVPNSQSLGELIRKTIALYPATLAIRRLFIDEITAVKDWTSILKRLLDAGELKKVLVITTGSRATDLHRGPERLPGRKGKFGRTEYLFTPVCYRTFHRACSAALGQNTLAAYLLSGGSPAALNELAKDQHLTEYRIESVRDWVYGECAASGRSRASLLAVLQFMAHRGGAPIGQAKLARETGLANNTVAAGYIDFLTDLLCVAQAAPWDPSKKIPLLRKPSKIPFINLLVAATWHPERPRSIEDYRRLTPEDQGAFHEWAVAQEIWRRRAKSGEEMPELLTFWQSKDHEIDYVIDPELFVEVKRGMAGPMEFNWFSNIFPKGKLQIVNTQSFETDHLKGITLEQFLLEQD